MNDLHRTTDEFVVRTEDGREITVVEYTPEHEETRDGRSATGGIKNVPRLRTADGLPVTDIGDGLYRVLDPGGAVTASRVDDG